MEFRAWGDLDLEKRRRWRGRVGRYNDQERHVAKEMQIQVEGLGGM